MTHSFPTRRSSDLFGDIGLLPPLRFLVIARRDQRPVLQAIEQVVADAARKQIGVLPGIGHAASGHGFRQVREIAAADRDRATGRLHKTRSEEHTSELQSLMRISYAVFCLKK